MTVELFLQEESFQPGLGIQIFQNLIRSLTNFGSSMIYRPCVPLWQLVSTAIHKQEENDSLASIRRAHKLLENTGDLFCCLKHVF